MNLISVISMRDVHSNSEFVTVRYTHSSCLVCNDIKVPRTQNKIDLSLNQHRITCKLVPLFDVYIQKQFKKKLARASSLSIEMFDTSIYYSCKFTTVICRKFSGMNLFILNFIVILNLKINSHLFL
uniref:Uncharacterized protein n=1 Tax=Heterorhabditis bacteriophora TaxID=37862 RepID=A0A1I7XA32_HETBA